MWPCAVFHADVLDPQTAFALCVWEPGASAPAVRGRPGQSQRLHCGEQPETLRRSDRLLLLYQGEPLHATKREWTKRENQEMLKIFS